MTSYLIIIHNASLIFLFFSIGFLHTLRQILFESFGSCLSTGISSRVQPLSEDFVLFQVGIKLISFKSLGLDVFLVARLIARFIRPIILHLIVTFLFILFAKCLYVSIHVEFAGESFTTAQTSVFSIHYRYLVVSDFCYACYFFRSSEQNERKPHWVALLLIWYTNLLLHNSLKSVKHRQIIAQYNSYYTTSRNSLKIQTRLWDQSIVDLLGKLIPSVLTLLYMCCVVLLTCFFNHLDVLTI